MNHRHLAIAVLAALVTAACTGTNGHGLSDDIPTVNFEPPSDTSEPPSQATKGPPPDFGPTVTLTDKPPPLSGGTLLLTKDGKYAVAADPDRDQVYIVALVDNSVVTVSLQKHDEPGRVIEDDAGHAHVVLRGGGGFATIDLATGTLLARRATCASPRGIAFDAASGSGRVLVACEGGAIVQTARAPDAVPAPFAQLDRDLRDILVAGGKIRVSRFRSAEIIELDMTGAVVSRTQLSDDFGGGNATLAWRMIAAPPGSPTDAPVVVHQAATNATVIPAPGGYGSGGGPLPDVDALPTGGIVTSAIWNGTVSLPLPTHAVLPVDIAFDGASFAVVAAGNGHTKSLPQVFVIAAHPAADGVFTTGTHLDVAGQATSIAFRTDGANPGYVVQSREPAQLQLFPSGVIVPLSPTSREDTGHAIFHSNSGAGLACASCHGEGRDDGHVWNFTGTGLRRTPSLLGTLQGTAPYHWAGEMTDLSMLVDDVMTGRMNGPNILPPQKDALQSWLFALPGPVAAPAAADAVARGLALFTSAQVGCAGCHSGPMLTSSATLDVGTGGAFQVPSLVGVGARAPYLHDGCAATLTDRFGACGGGDRHGTTSTLTTAEIGDLVTYLGTL